MNTSQNKAAHLNYYVQTAQTAKHPQKSTCLLSHRSFSKSTDFIIAWMDNEYNLSDDQFKKLPDKTLRTAQRNICRFYRFTSKHIKKDRSRPLLKHSF